SSAATADLKDLRVGCVCRDGDNQERLKHAWNLCTPDWEATLLPVRYSRAHIGKYEHWSAPNSTVLWQAMTENTSSGVMQMMSEQTWNDFGNSSLPGSAITHPVNINNKELNNLLELERLKIY
ncbi:MAG: hypothetical protein J6X55_08205, partial [Victivallales bacterium]|nr:hypothetical protein [Victivallales bacterium]